MLKTHILIGDISNKGGRQIKLDFLGTCALSLRGANKEKLFNKKGI